MKGKRKAGRQERGGKEGEGRGGVSAAEALQQITVISKINRPRKTHLSVGDKLSPRDWRVYRVHLSVFFGRIENGVLGS